MRQYGLIGIGTSVATGDTHTCFTVNREVYCAGANSVGQFGSGHTTSSTIPSRSNSRRSRAPVTKSQSRILELRTLLR
ncbi:MAG: hypothetical protein ACM3ZE_16550 [Myxococcales bacterium]